MKYNRQKVQNRILRSTLIFLGLFGIEVNTPRRHVSQEEQATEGEAGINSQAPVVQPAPTAPTISTMPVFGEE